MGDRDKTTCGCGKQMEKMSVYRCEDCGRKMCYLCMLKGIPGAGFGACPNCKRPLRGSQANLCGWWMRARRTPNPLSGGESYRRVLPAVAWVHAADRGKGTG